MAVLHEDRCEAEAVVGFSKARVEAAGEQLVSGRAMAIAGIKISEWVPSKAKGVYLAPGVVFDARAVEAHSVSVAGIEIHLVAVAAFHMRIVVESMRGVKPAVKAPPERGLIAVGVTGVIERAVEHLALVCFAIAVCIFHEPNIWDGPSDAFPSEAQFSIAGRTVKGVNANGNVEAVREDRYLASKASFVEVGKNPDRVARRLIEGRSEWIFTGFGDPKPAHRIEGHVHRFTEIRLRGHQLNFKSRRQVKFPQLLRRRQRISVSNALGKRISAHDRKLAKQGSHCDHRRPNHSPNTISQLLAKGILFHAMSSLMLQNIISQKKNFLTLA